MARGKRAAAVSDEPVEGPWELPEGWRWERLGNLGQWYGGGTPSKANSAFWTGGDIPWVSPKDMKVGYLEDAEDHITREALTASSAKLVPSGSVVFVMRSGILSHSLPIAVTRRDVALNQDLRAVRPRDDVTPEFLAHYLNAAAQAILHVCRKDGTTVSSIETDRLMAWPVPVCPPEMQDWVAGTIDALFDDIEEGEGALANAREATVTYRQALLKAAVTGELTADWRAANPPVETGETLLNRILDARRARWEADPKNARKRYVEPEGPEVEDLPDLPDTWTWASVEQLGNVVTGATPPTSRTELYGGDVAFFTPTDLDGGYGLSASRRTITEAGLATVRPIAANSVMVTCIGATIGKTGHTLVSGATNQQINSIVPELELLATYLFAYFSGPVGKTRVIEQSSSTTLPILNKGDFSRLPVPLPSLPELLQINATLDAALKRQAEGIAGIDGLSASPTELRQSILAAAFRGELV